MNIHKGIVFCVCCVTWGISFAEAQVIDESQNYAYNEQTSQAMAPETTKQAVREDDENVFVISEQQPTQKGDENGTDDSNAEPYQLLLSKIERMQQEIADLRGRLEVQDHILRGAGAKLPEVKEPSIAPVKVEALAKANAKPPSETKPLPKQDNTLSETAKLAEAAAIHHSDDPMDEQLSYVAAYEHVKQHRYSQAVAAMQNFITAYPDGPYAANAHYWLGELYLKNRQYNQSAKEFKTIISDFSDSNKLASAEYKLGVTYEKLGEKEQARAQFVKVTEEFPGTAIARLAKTKIS